MRLSLALACLLAAAFPVAGASPPMANGYGAKDAVRDITPVKLGELFCAGRISGDMTALERFFAPKLVTLLTETPAGTGIPWQSVPAPPSGCDASVLFGIDDTIGVLVELTYAAEGRRWTDTLNLERTPTSWRINNVFYQGGGNLRFRLFDALP